jgi:CrcB protein
MTSGDRDELPIDSDLSPADPVAPSADHSAAARRRRAPSSRRAQADVLGAIAAGGALGAPARYGVAQLVHVGPDSFPWATFWTNISGSFALGLLLILVLERFPPTRYVRPFLATGFLGAYTTYSTFAVETDLLAKDGHIGLTVTYAVSSLVVGFAAVWAGIAIARALPLGKGDRR